MASCGILRAFLANGTILIVSRISIFMGVLLISQRSNSGFRAWILRKSQHHGFGQIGRLDATLAHVVFRFDQHLPSGVVLVANAGELSDGLFAEAPTDVAGLEAHAQTPVELGFEVRVLFRMPR